MVTIYLAQPEFIPRRSLFHSSASWCIYPIVIIYIMVPHQTRLHSFIRSWAVVLLSFFPLKLVAALYPTVRLSHWRQVQKNIHSRVWTPGTTWSVVHPGGLPLLVPHSFWWLGDMGLTHGDWSGLLSRVATPGTTRSCIPPEGLLSWSPYP